jgi:hypothetical protein
MWSVTPAAASFGSPTTRLGRTPWAALCLVVLVGLAALVCGVLAPASASAQAPYQSYAFAGNVVSQGARPGGVGSYTRRLAVDPTTSNLLVADSGGPWDFDNRVAVYAPGEGGSVSSLTEFGVGTLVDPFGIAVDPVSGAVYVSDKGSARIVRFTSDGASTPTYTLDASFVSPVQGSGPGQVGDFQSALAVDPGSRDLLVADAANGRVNRYSSSGVFVGSFDGTGTAGGPFPLPGFPAELTGVTDLAVGAGGVVYVTVYSGDFFTSTTSRVERFSASGTPLGQLGPDQATGAVAADPSTGLVIVGGNRGKSRQPTLISFAGGQQVAQTDFSSVLDVHGLAVTPGAGGPVYALTTGQFGTGQVELSVFLPRLAAGVAISEPSEVTATSMRLRGTVDPGGEPTTAHFEWSADRGVTWTAAPDLEPLDGEGSIPVEDELSGLEPNTSYLVRLVAQNEARSSATTPREVTTATAPPAVITGAGSDATLDEVTLSGTVNPFGLQTTYHFEYGATSAYGSRVPVNANGVVGKGRVPRAVTRQITGLVPGATYHYRLVARNAAGTAYGDDRAFTLAARAQEARGYEQVSPRDKGGAPVDIYQLQARPDGLGIAYQTPAAIDTPQGSAPRTPRYLGMRGAEDWSFVALDPPLFARPGETGQVPMAILTTTLAVSRDLTMSFVASNRALAPGAQDGAGNLYRRDNETGAYELVVSGPRRLFAEATDAGGSYVFFQGASDDFDTITFTSELALTDDATPGVWNLYVWRNGTLRLASVLPGGAPASGPYDFGGNQAPQQRRVSADGSKIYFAIAGEGAFLRETSGSTVAVSVSEREEDAGAVRPASVVTSSADGRVAFIQTGDGVRLTDDTPEQASSLYRFVLGEGLRYIGGAAYTDFLGASDDAAVIYFVAGAFDAAAQNGFFVWDAGSGSVDRVGPVDLDPLRSLVPQASPSGRYLSFSSYQRLGTYDNRNATACGFGAFGATDNRCYQSYLYDRASGDLTCVSCPRDGSRSLGHSAGNATLGLSGYQPRKVTDRGELFFDTPTGLVGADGNGTRDVYRYADGEVSLISRGTVSSQSYFADTSSDGRSVFFVTDDRLVGQDQDDTTDMYVSRPGGGIAAQNPRADPTCRGVECRAPAVAPVVSAPQPTESPSRTSEPGPSKVTRARITIRGATVKGSVLRVRVQTSVSGRLRVSGRGLTSSVRQAERATSYTLSLRLSKSSRTALREKRRLKVRITASVVPSFGASASAALTRTVRK